MTARVTATEVKAIFETSLADAALTTFITTANQIVTDELSTQTSLSTDRLKQIELYLAAHFACMWEPRAKSESAGEVGETIEGMTGMGFQWSRYGQQALMLDTSGRLAAMQEGQGKRTPSINLE